MYPPDRKQEKLSKLPEKVLRNDLTGNGYD